MNYDFICVCLSFLAPFLTGMIIFFMRKGLLTNVILSLVSIAFALFSTFYSFYILKYGESLSLDFYGFFFLDGFGIFMQFMVEFVTIFVILYSLKELPQNYFHRTKHFHFYFSMILISTGFMNLAFSLNNLFLIYIALELSSIVAVYLIAFNLTKEALKAGFRYLIVVNVGILFSLLAIVFIYYSTGQEVSISSMGQIVSSLSRDMALLCAGLFIIGFFTKAGLMPFHIWLPDAYAESPTAVTFFLAGAVTKIGFYGLARTVTAFAYNLEEIRLIVIILASLSMLFGAVLSFNQRDIKKLIAYCSISEMGLIASAFVLSSYSGFWGGVFHMLNHTLMKGALFLSVGALIYLCGSRKIEDISLLPKKNSVIIISFIIGAMAVGGMPPFSSFLSAVTVIFNLAEERFFWSSVILAISGFISVIALLRTANAIFWAKNEEVELKSDTPLPALMIFCSLFLAILLIVGGVYPEFIYCLIDSAAKSILSTIH